ncbi:MAG: hypothetical protein J6U23_14515 [Clostridiales bacterium]|nr:hypothetical protein [Clostridiales bacterium]
MKRKLIKALSMVLVSVALFATITGFRTVGTTTPGASLINQSYSNGHGDYTICGTHYTYIYGEWSDKYKVNTYSSNFVLYTTYERSRCVYKICTDCQKLISVEYEYQRRTNAWGIPIEGWYNV